MVVPMNFEAEILDLKRRVGDLEGAISVLTGQLRLVHPELVAWKEDAGAKLTRLDGTMSKIDTRLEKVELQVWSLRDDLPDIVHAAVIRAGRTAPERP
jgi:hypothetical protein